MTTELVLPGIRLTHFAVPARQKLRDHAHSNFHILCLLGGGMEEAQGAGSQHLRSGGVRLSRAHGVHDIDFADGESRCAVLHVTDAGAARLSLPDIAASHFLPGAGLFAAVRDAVDHGASDPARLWLRVREALAAAHAALRPGEDVPPDWLVDIRRALAGRSPRRRTGHLARQARVSAEHLARQFRHHFGMTVGEARRIAMLGRALELTRTDMPLAEVALAAGFAHQSHLTNVMRDMLGVTPRACRRRLAAC